VDAVVVDVDTTDVFAADWLAAWCFWIFLKWLMMLCSQWLMVVGE